MTLQQVSESTALYNTHENDGETGPVIRRLGIPCVVKAVMPIAKTANTFIYEAICGGFMERRGVRTANGGEAEGYLREPLSADCIVRIIQFDSPAFAQMTGCESWELHL